MKIYGTIAECSHTSIFSFQVIELMIFAKDSEASCTNCKENFQTRRNLTMEPLVVRRRQTRSLQNLRPVPLVPIDLDIPTYYENSEDEERDRRHLELDYENLCEIVTEHVELRDEEYDFIPPVYNEVYCKYYSLLSEDERKSVHPSKQKCAYPAFHCVQRSRKLFALRRRWDSTCWEPYTKQIHSGCDCMWPTENLGAISQHY